MTKIKKQANQSLFEYQERMEKLGKAPLDKLNDYIEWEDFRPILTELLAPKEQKAPGGASHYDYVFMFKILIIQKYYNLSDEQTEFRINDSLSLQRFLGITLADKVPDHNKIWDFREKLMKSGAIKGLFKAFDTVLESQGIVGKSGSIIDASFVEVPIQRNNRDENKNIKEGKTPKEWKDNPNKLSHKDTDARWMKKDNKTHYGYKNHVKADILTKIVREYTVTDASVHDSMAVKELLNEKDTGKTLYADSAYIGPKVESIVSQYRIKNFIHEKGYRNKPLRKGQKKLNRLKSAIRCRVEHIFGFIENSMNGSFIRTIGKKRAETNIGLMNLVYNMARYSFIMRQKSQYFV
jgi:IS5 family transposase